MNIQTGDWLYCERNRMWRVTNTQTQTCVNTDDGRRYRRYSQQGDQVFLGQWQAFHKPDPARQAIEQLVSDLDALTQDTE
jgi:hypothetical protein